VRTSIVIEEELIAQVLSSDSDRVVVRVNTAVEEAATSPTG